MGRFSRTIETYIAYQLLNKLATPFGEWPAFEMGLIDKKGNKIRDAKTNEEKDQFSRLNNIARNLKKILDKYAGAENKLAAALIGTTLMKEEAERINNEVFTDRFFEIILGNDYTNYLCNLSENKREPLVPGRYKVDSPFYEKQHICYVRENLFPDSDNIFRLEDVLGEEIICNNEDLTKF